ncbi:hypothetical protein M9Y10_024415 [Tritrichomonas musculus]|uniref:Uncharacterized protein n=1 Tax=Tritrichomonas musculus TaxID=1915356 RepID=A0ABR2HCP6_9EUKA
MSSEMNVIPKWIKEHFPEQLKEALEGNYSKPTVTGRKEAIDVDNVKDLAFYVNKTGVFKQDQFHRPIKGIGCYPYEYSRRNKKYVCNSYLHIKRTNEDPLINTKQNSNSPSWYKYLQLYLEDGKDLNPDIMYEVIYESNHPIQCIKLIVKKFSFDPSKNNNRKTQNKDKDFELYNILDEKEKDHICKLLHDKKINLDIKNKVVEEGNYDRISKILDFYELANYCIDNHMESNYINYIDENSKNFVNLGNIKLVNPKFKEFYTYAYKKTKIKEEMPKK